MSTILDRMIRRTRGPLSALEPVTTPAFAAGISSELAGAGQAGFPGPLDSWTEVTVAEPGAVAARPEAHRAGPAHGEHANSGLVPVPGTPAPPLLSPELLSPAPPTPAPPTLAPSSAALPSPAPSPELLYPELLSPALPWALPGVGLPPVTQPAPTGQRAAPHPHRHEDQPGPDPGAQAGSEPDQVPERGIHASDAAPAVRRAAATLRRPQEAAAAQHAAAAAAMAGVELGGVEPAGVELAGVEPGVVPARPPGQWPGQPLGQLPTSTPPHRPGRVTAGSQGVRTEVTISIGHIEVRSAPGAEQPSTRAPFRPQVSLADFLGQDRRL
jgi:hypothetical protein